MTIQDKKIRIRELEAQEREAMGRYYDEEDKLIHDITDENIRSRQNALNKLIEIRRKLENLKEGRPENGYALEVSVELPLGTKLN